MTAPARQGALIAATAPPGTVTLRRDGQPLRLAADRRFLLGFGRDDAEPVALEAELADGTRLRQTLFPAVRRWDIDRLPAVRRGPIVIDPAFDRLRAEQVAAIRAAQSVLSAEPGWREAFVWPAKGRISGRYGDQRFLGSVPRAPHFGLDIAAPSGTPFVAPAGGVVRLAGGPFVYEGNMVILDHGNGLSSQFMHLSRIDVAVGQRVARGQRLGAIGSTGRSTGPHLHWGLTLLQPGAEQPAVRLDPEPLLPSIAKAGRPAAG